MEMVLKELVSHPLQLQETEVVEINAKKIGALQSDEHLDILTKIRSEVCSAKEGYSYVQVDLIPASGNFQLGIIMRGKFVSENAISKEQFERFLLVQGVKILWSYVREVVYDITGRMLRSAFLLPTLDVVQTLMNAKKEDEDIKENGKD